jgi:hypothetical protein
VKEEPNVEVKEEPNVEVKEDEIKVILEDVKHLEVATDNKIQELEEIKLDTLDNLSTNNDCSLSDTSSTTSSIDVDNAIKDDSEPAKKKRGRKKKAT